MKIIGIDPGFNRLGWAVLEKQGSVFNILAADLIETSPKTEYRERVLQIGKEIDLIFKKYEPDSLAIEKVFFTTNQKTAFRVAEIKGVITYLAAKAGLEYFEFTPLEIKSSVCGYGKADKKQIRDMLKLTLKSGNCDFELPKNDDVCDAIAVALTCAFRLKVNHSGSTAVV